MSNMPPFPIQGIFANTFGKPLKTAEYVTQQAPYACNISKGLSFPPKSIFLCDLDTPMLRNVRARTEVGMAFPGRMPQLSIVEGGTEVPYSSEQVINNLLYSWRGFSSAFVISRCRHHFAIYLSES